MYGYSALSSIEAGTQITRVLNNDVHCRQFKSEAVNRPQIRTYA